RTPIEHERRPRPPPVAADPGPGGRGRPRRTGRVRDGCRRDRDVGRGAPDDTAMAAFASCMAENGVTLPERGAPDGGAGTAGGAAAGGRCARARSDARVAGW